MAENPENSAMASGLPFYSIDLVHAGKVSKKDWPNKESDLTLVQTSEVPREAGCCRPENSRDTRMNRFTDVEMDLRSSVHCKPCATPVFRTVQSGKILRR
jgi:hypothetical protein